MVGVRVKKLRFSDGNVVPIPDDGMVLLVGPNNAGKSRALKDVMGFARAPQHVGLSLSSVDYEKRLDGNILEWVNNTIPRIIRNGKKLFQVEGWGEVTGYDITTQWNEQNLSVLTSLLVLHADGMSRLTAGDSQWRPDFSSEVPIHPVQHAHLSSDIEDEIDRESMVAFGLGVTVDRYGGSVVSLRLGERPDFEHTYGSPSGRYVAALKALPKLEEQGDGVRSYIGLVMHLAAG